MSLRANWLTLSRVLLALVFAWRFRVDDERALLTSLALLVLMGVSDILDGYLARRKNGGSRAGELIDSVADGFARFTALLVFLDARLLPVWMVLVIFWRDLISWGLRFMDLGQGRDDVHKRVSGKVNGAVQSAAIGITVVLAYLAVAGDRAVPLGVVWWLMLASAGTSVWSTLDLLYTYRRTLRRFTWRDRAEDGRAKSGSA